MNELAADLNSGRYKNIVVMVGAGISVASGIPDFRSPKTGLYASIKQDAELRHKKSTFVFELKTFKEDSRPFWWIFGRMAPLMTEAQPTAFHCFIELLHRHNLLLRCYTQNVDGLETAAGLPDSLVVHAHGVQSRCHCMKCHSEVSMAYCLESIQSNLAQPNLSIEETVVPICPKCGSDKVKPDVVFFSEDLPDRFFDMYPDDLESADLLIIAGTSLNVYPFAKLPSKAGKGVKRYVINLVPPDGIFRFSSQRDWLIQGDCQESIIQLVKLLGWDKELASMMQNRSTLGNHWMQLKM